MALDELIDSVTVYKTLPLYFHGEVFPFLGLYCLTVYLGLYVYDYEEYGEIFMLVVGVLALLQVLTCLCCFWSVHIRCFLSCRKVICLNFYLYFLVVHNYNYDILFS